MNADQRMRLRAVLFPAMAQVRDKMRPLRRQADELSQLAESGHYASIDVDDLLARVRGFHASVKDFSDVAIPVMEEALAETRAILQEEPARAATTDGR